MLEGGGRGKGCCSEEFEGINHSVYKVQITVASVLKGKSALCLNRWQYDSPTGHAKLPSKSCPHFKNSKYVFDYSFLFSVALSMWCIL